MPAEWLRPEYRGREDELETRGDFEKRTGLSALSLSSHFARYADILPKVVKQFGKQKYFVASELDDFLKTIADISRTRSPADIARAEIARLEMSLAAAEDRVRRHKEALAKAERDQVRHQRKLKQKREDLRFLQQGE